MSAKKKTVATSTKKKTAKKTVAKKKIAKKAIKKAVSKKVTTKKKSAKPKAVAKPKKAAKKVTTPKAKAVKKTAAKKAKSSSVTSTAKTSKRPAADKVVKKKVATMKMTPFIRKQRQRLLDLRDVMVDTTQGITRDTLHSSNGGSDASGSGMHTGDAGSDAYDKDLALNILSKETDALYEIEEALLRIENKTYGICEMCGDPIPEVRLEALPFCRLTIACQTEVESKNGYGKSRKEAVGYGRGR